MERRKRKESAPDERIQFPAEIIVTQRSVNNQVNIQSIKLRIFQYSLHGCFEHCTFQIHIGQLDPDFPAFPIHRSIQTVPQAVGGFLSIFGGQFR